MTELQFRTVSVAVVFEYPNPIPRESLSNGLSEEGYSISSLSRQQLTLGESNVQIGEAVGGDPRIGEKGDIEIVYNPDATLSKYGNCAFITVRSELGSEFENILSEMEVLLDLLEDRGIHEQVAFFEATVDTVARVEDSYNLTTFYSDGVLDDVADPLGERAKGISARFEADVDNPGDGWYRLLIDSEGTKNPFVWRVNLQKRYDELADINRKTITEELERVVDRSREEM